MPEHPAKASATPSEGTVLRLADLSKRKPSPFDVAPDAGALRALQREMELSDLRKLRLWGEIRPIGRADWHLEATLGATVVQPCGVTLAPVTTRIEETVTRRFLADWAEPDGAEIEMPEDDNAGPVPTTLDLAALLAEELALAVPLYPRAEGADLGEAVFTEPGKAAMTDEDAKPFAALAKLKLVPKDDAE